MATSTIFPPGHEQDTMFLLDRARQGSRDAWDALYRRYRTLLLVGIRIRIPGFAQRRFDREDLLQTAFVSALSSIEQFEYRGEGSFRRWLTALVVNAFKSKMREHEREQCGLPMDVASGDETLASEADAAPAPAEAAADSELRAKVLAAMATMEEGDQEILCMRKFESLSWSDIGRILECDRRAAQRRYAKAISRLTHRMA